MHYGRAFLVLVLLAGYVWDASPSEADLSAELVLEDAGGYAPSRGLAPLRPVLDYLRYYESQPARVLPYVTDHFRSGLEPRAWVDQTRALLAAQGYTRLSWLVHHLETHEKAATVHVTTRARIDGQELLQREIFTLIYTPEGAWLIDDWHLE